jgi:hypothetical protein
VFLEEPKLMPIFSELCRDIVDSTRVGIDPMRAGTVVLTRIERWRTLLQADSSGLNRFALRGLIGELLVLEQRIFPMLGPVEAIAAWTGPLGMAQDFHLPSGLRIEVKAVDHDANQVLINGLSQLDSGGDTLVLAVVRLEDTGHDAVNAVTVPLLVEQIRARLSESPEALLSFVRIPGEGERDSGVKPNRIPG